MDDATARAKFGSIYDQHRRAVLVYCMRRARQEDALDALNETFAIVWRRIDQRRLRRTHCPGCTATPAVC